MNRGKQNVLSAIRWQASAAILAMSSWLGACDDADPVAPRTEAVRLQDVSAQGTVTVTIDQNATVLEQGQTLMVRGFVTCTPVAGATEPLEAFVQVSQDEGFIFGEGFIPNVECNGRPQRYLLRAQVIEGTFHRGEAFAGAFVLVCDDEGSVCEQGQASRTIIVRGRPSDTGA